MTKFAAGTEVPVERTRAEIETIVRRYGADGYLSGWEGRKAMVQFRVQGRHVKLIMELPDPAADEFHTYKQGSTTFGRAAGVPQKLWEQACRQKWRALALLVKAKLEAVESGIVTFEQEFLPHIVMPDGDTVYQHVKANVALAYEKGEMPPMLPDYSGDDRAPQKGSA